MKLKIKKRWNTKLYFMLLISIFCIILLSSIVLAPPSPHNVEGKIMTNESSGVQNGIPVLINETVTGDLVLTYVNAPPIDLYRGDYSATINGNDGDLIIVLSWNSTHWGQSNTTLLPTTTTVDVKLNRTRGSETNVTIIEPLNNTLKNKTIPFNVTVNISVIVADGIGCNATIAFSDNGILNISDGGNYTKFLGNIPEGDYKIINWSIKGLNEGNSNLTVYAECESDDRILENTNLRHVYNITVVNLLPYVKDVYLDQDVNLIAGSNLTLYCNASVIDYNSVDDIKNVNATFYQQSLGSVIDDDNNYHYTNSSCVNFSSSKFEKNFTCGFSVAYYANNGTWECNVIVEDYSNKTNSSNASTRINELLAIDIEPSVLDYGNLIPTETSHDDVNLTITNFGNVGFNVSVYGYGIHEGDNLSMDCERRNISIWNQRYSIKYKTVFDEMTNLSANATIVYNMTFPQRTDDIAFGQDRNKTYWKLEVPPSISGICNGTLVFRTVII